MADNKQTITKGDVGKVPAGVVKGAPVSQTLPQGQVAPAAPAVKVKAPKKELTAEQIALKKTMDEARAKFNAAIGKEPKARTGAPRGTSSYGGFDPEAKVTLVDGNVAGFASADDKAVKDAIPKDGMTLKALLALPNTSYGWFISRLSRNSFKVNGLTMAEAFNKAKAA